MDDYFSGVLAQYGQAGIQRDQAAANYVNGHGGINGHKVKFVQADAGAAGASGDSAAIQLIDEDHVSAIVGLTISNDCGIVATLATAHKVPILCISTPATNLSPVQPYVFGLNPVEAQQVPAVQKFVQTKLNIPSGGTFATISEQDAGAQGFSDLSEKALTKVGYKDVENELVPLTSVTATSEIAKVVAAKPAFVVSELASQYFLPLVQQLRAAGNSAPVISADGALGYPQFQSIDDAHTYGIEVTQYVDALTPTTGATEAEFIAGMESIGLNTPTAINGAEGSFGFLANLALFQALGACGYPCSGAKLATQLQQVNLPAPGLLDGDIGWTPSSHVMIRQLYIFGYDTTKKQPVVELSGLPLGPITG